MNGGDCVLNSNDCNGLDGVHNIRHGSKKGLDLVMGMANENFIEPVINRYFDMTVKNTKLTKGKYCAYDYECEETKTRYELKSRRIRHNQYETVYLSTRKIEKGAEHGYRLILLFFFTDGLYFTEYSKATFKTYTKKLLSICRDGRWEDDNVYNIPTDCLTKLEL